MKTILVALVLTASLAGCTGLLNSTDAPAPGGCYPGASVQCRGLNTA